MAPLNIIGELSKVISISFRLFGNIMGGTIIILVVSHLVFSLVLPPFLNAFFVIFIGAIQAFVFTMLTLVYIAVQVN
jgi:F-type H+-transporting ATPase subunit a